MKKSLSLLLAVCLALALCAPALAAGDLDVTQDTHLPYLVNKYNNVTVRSGATLSMENWRPDAPGLEVSGSLTVEAGGAVTGGSLIFERGATCTGVDLYYVVAGEEKPLEVTLAKVVEEDPNDDYRPVFLYDLDTGHYVLLADFSNDPFEVRPPYIPPGEGDGNDGGVDDDTVQIAEKLRSLGLFLGTDAGFELERAPTRVEAVIMLLRLKGLTAEAAAWPAENCPFSDVPGWARCYIAYAYDTGLTLGSGGDQFGMGDATAQMFCTFVLRALGYSDGMESGADFTYAGAVDFAMEHGLAGEGDIGGFNRGACVRIMSNALRQSMKDGTRLWEKLAADGLFTEEQYGAAFG